jgi:hypothetical protein
MHWTRSRAFLTKTKQHKQCRIATAGDPLSLSFSVFSVFIKPTRGPAPFDFEECLAKLCLLQAVLGWWEAACSESHLGGAPKKNGFSLAVLMAIFCMLCCEG